MGESSLLLWARHLGGEADAVEVDVHYVPDVLRVAAGHRHGDRDAALPAALEDHAVPLGGAGLRNGEAAQAVADERVGACEVDRQPWFRGVERPLQAFAEGFEEGGVVCAAGEGGGGRG